MTTISFADAKRAGQIRDHILDISKAVQTLDNVKDVDYDPKAGSVVMNDTDLGAAKRPSLIIADRFSGWNDKDKVFAGQVTFDPKSGAPSGLKIKTARDGHDDFESRPNAHMTYTMETINNGTIQVYKQDSKGFWEGDNEVDTVKVDAATGNILSLREHAYGIGFPMACLQMATTLSGIGLTTFGAVCGLSVAGGPGALVGGAAVFFGFAAIKALQHG